MDSPPENAKPSATRLSWSSVVAVTIGGLVGLFVPSFYAVPRIAAVFEDHNAAIPAAARAGIAFAELLRSHWLLLGLAALVLFAALGVFVEFLRGRSRLLAALLILAALLCYPVFLFVALYGPVSRL